MLNSSGGFGEGDSVNSFGDHRSFSEGEPTRHPSSNLTQHTTPAPETREENKDINSSSDTANFFHNSQPDLSFDNDSVMGAASTNLIHLRAGIDPRNNDSNEQSVGGPEESSYSSYATSNHDELTSQTRSTRTQDNHASPVIPHPTFALNLGDMIRRAENHESSAPTIRMYRQQFSQAEDDQSLDRSRPLFEEQIEEILDEMMFLMSNRRASCKDMKDTLNEQKKSFAEYYNGEREKLLHEKERWSVNIKKANALYEGTDSIFSINIGGTHKITVSKRTLCKVPESMLTAMFSGRHKLRKHKGKVFIDRDGDAFCAVISYLRNGKVPYFTGKEQENLFYEELDYWQIPAVLSRSEAGEITEFDPVWCATTLRLENNNLLVRKHGIFDLEEITNLIKINRTAARCCFLQTLL